VRPHALRGDVFRRLDLQAKRIAVKLQRGVQVPNGDAHVIQRYFHDHL